MSKAEECNHTICNICKDEGWVCENHSEVAWNGGNQKCCGGAGAPCVCNTSNPPWHHGIGKKQTVSIRDEMARRGAELQGQHPIKSNRDSFLYGFESGWGAALTNAPEVLALVRALEYIREKDVLFEKTGTMDWDSVQGMTIEALATYRESVKAEK